MIDVTMTAFVMGFVLGILLVVLCPQISANVFDMFDGGN